ncbi:MAG TPA: alkaline phosphatase family protein [Gemmatimonadaceae bacterium]|nr:alkaline phosphatase family protein [Gemmatimonadaceae bacterium]
MPVIVIVADGARPDVLDAAMQSGKLPAMRALRDEGSFHTITSVFPSVTGPAYTPFVMGRYPGPVGLPGLRWYDRTRTSCRLPGNSRSYVGFEMRHVDSDLDPDAPTIFEIAPTSLAALNVIGRGLGAKDLLGRSIPFALRTARTHFTGRVPGWLEIDREISGKVVQRIKRDHPSFVFAALTGIDKTSHSEGHEGAYVQKAYTIVDDTVAAIRHDAERRGTWEQTHIWVVSDHGHSPVREHDDIVGLIGRLGFRAIAHPWVFSTRGEVAVMVSGNAMAHIYLDLPRRTRPWLRDLGERWQPVRDALLARDSVDLMILPVSIGSCEIHSRSHGFAVMSWERDRISYRPATGDPLGIGSQHDLDDEAAYDVCLASDYPDALVQIARLCDSPRSGEIILSASRNWDFRAKYEPIPHFSSHGALHREHMLVPLLTSKPVARTPRRTVDVMPSALTALGLPVPMGLDGKSFL